MTNEERISKAQDIIGFLAAFDTSYNDAIDILSKASAKIIFLGEEEYKASGTNLATFVQLMGQGKPA